MHFHLRVGSDITNWERMDQFCWAISRAAVWASRLGRVDIHPIECHSKDCLSVQGIEQFIMMNPGVVDTWATSSI